MSLVNVLLEGGPLTSSKNKFLQHSLRFDSFDRPENNEYPSKKQKNNSIPPSCTTENKILLQNRFKIWKDGPIKKKKKKVLPMKKRCLQRYFLKVADEDCVDFELRDNIVQKKKKKAKKKKNGLSGHIDFYSHSLDSVCDGAVGHNLSESEEDDCSSRSRGSPENLHSEAALYSPMSCSTQAQPSAPMVLGNKQVQPNAPMLFGNMPANFCTPMLLRSQAGPAFGGAAGVAFGSAPGPAFGSAPGFTFGSAPGSGFALGKKLDSASIPVTIISQMPSYKLETLNISVDVDSEFFSFDVTTRYQSKDLISDPKERKMYLLNVVSMALMYPASLRNDSSNYRKTLDKSVDDVRFFDPEFILKVALYTRQELHLRTVTNFLLAYAAIHENTHLYLEKYFEACIVLPADWIEVAEYYRMLNGKAFPSVLRRAMRKTFSKFDQYQLAKYNRDKSKKKKSKSQAKDFEEKDEDEGKILVTEDTDLEESVPKYTSSFTLKKLIRILHINSPTEHVMCLLGKKYPENFEAFKSSGLPGTWDSAKAGHRMKLPIPETWETKLPLCGNVPEAWESLIDNNKLPYMAMLRNLRNLILSGISEMHHNKAIKYLENKNAVINSRQLPLQFFEAYKVISGLEKMLENKDSEIKDYNPAGTPFWQICKRRKLKERIDNASLSTIQQYKNAIAKALEISSLNNLHPVPGKTLVICVIDPSLCRENFKSCETCLMMGLMCLKACENCKMNVLCLSANPDVISLNEKDKFLDVLLETCEKYRQLDLQNTKWKISVLEKVLDFYLRPPTMLSLKLDHIVLLQNTNSPVQDVMSSFLNKYRQIVNPNLLYTNVNHSLTSQGFSESCLSEKDVYLCGSSNSLIKFIAERSSGGQLYYVENIDEKYNLPKIEESKKYAQNKGNVCSAVSSTSTSVPVNYRIPKWHTVRIFISSTFKDMMSERDLLIKYVFPELRRRAASVFVRIVEVDLRWGITEADSATKRAAELCLLEAQKADLFVGFVGDRYGSVYNFDPPDSFELEWVKDICHGLSITELEMHAAALRNPEMCQQKAFFYFRNNSFLRHVPQKYINDFDSEDSNSKNLVEALKSKIRAHKFKVFDGYPCFFAGVYENKPILAGLDVLGNKVLDDLWRAVQDVHKKDPYFNTVGEEEIYQQSLIDSQHFYVGEKSSPLDVFIKNLTLKRGVFVLCGCPGSGKTAFAINLLQHLKDFNVVHFFIGVSPRSRDLTYMIQYILDSICHKLSISISLPQSPLDIVNQFPDILLEAASCRGSRDIIILIDGLDHLETEHQRLDWLPLSLPDGIKIVCTATESSEAFKFLTGRQMSGNDIFIEELSLLIHSDREKFVRNYLSYYSKTLDQSAFNNHLLKIVTKKDSSNPFYLRVVCDFLRTYATFENFSSVLQKIPSSISFLFQEIILQMENEFGSPLVQTTLILLCITKEGLEDNDLHFILSFVMHLTESKKFLDFNEVKEKIKFLEPEQMLSPVKYCSLMYVISTFAYGSVIGRKSYSLVGTLFENAVEKFYLNKNYVSHSIYLHSVLAGYYYNLSNLNEDGLFTQKPGFAMRSFLYHLFHAKLYKELCNLLCSLKFLETAFKSNVGAQLLEYFSSILYDILPSNHKISHDIDSNLLPLFSDFVTRNFHIFCQHPQLIMQQALNEPSDSLVSLQSKDCNYHSLENLSRSQMLDYRLASFCGFVKIITASASAKNQGFVVLGMEDGYLKVLDLSVHKVVRTIKGHVSAITSIAFVGKNKMCVSSIDGTLSLWDSIDFTRIALLKGHRHNVTSCCADPAGSILYSSGWDNSVRLWSLSDGRLISIIDEFRYPVNCIDHHPAKQQIACGLWSGNIEIWDTVSLKKILVLPSFCGSVKSLAYTPNGVNIISSFIESEISIWSSEEGMKISSLEGHILPVKSLSFFPDDSVFISGSDDCTLKVWSTEHGSHFATISDTKFCPISLMSFMTENLLAVAFQNSDIWIIDINSGKAISKIKMAGDFVSTFSKYSSVTSITFMESEISFIEKFVIFGTKSGKLMIGDLLTSSVSVKSEMNSKLTAMIHNCDTIICGTAEGDIGVFSYPDDMLFRIILSAHKGFVSTFSLAAEDEKLFVLSAANDNVLKFWNIDKINSDVNLCTELVNQHKDGITCSLFYPHSCDSISSLVDNLLTGSHDNNIISWNGGSQKVFKGLHFSVLDVACFGDFVLGCGNDGAIVIWSQNNKILSSIPGISQSSTLLTFFVAEDDLNKFTVTLAYVEQDGSIKITKPLQRTYSCSFDGHSKPVTSCCITENGNVVSCSLDGSVNLWKVPRDNSTLSMHSTVVTGVIVSPSLKFAVSADAHGNLIFWKIDLTAASMPLSYVGKKSVGNFIRTLSWFKENTIVYAVTKFLANDEENYFLHISSFEHNPSDDTYALNFQLKKTYYFRSEVLSLDTSSNSDLIIVGLKCGDIVVINSEEHHAITVSNDWLLGVQLLSGKGKLDLCCLSFVDGSLKLYQLDELLCSENKTAFPVKVHKAPTDKKGSKFTSSLCCGDDKLICSGDSGGILQIYEDDCLKFCEKVHSDAISGISIAGSYLFTSSLDKTVKGWNLKSFKQVCQFHSNVPISCIASPDVDVQSCDESSCLLLIGTVSGNVHLLKFHH